MPMQSALLAIGSSLVGAATHRRVCDGLDAGSLNYKTTLVRCWRAKAWSNDIGRVNTEGQGALVAPQSVPCKASAESVCDELAPRIIAEGGCPMRPLGKNTRVYWRYPR